MADFSFDTNGSSDGDAKPVLGTGSEGASGQPTSGSTGSEASGNDGTASNGARDPNTVAASGPKKRGRKPLPRDASGNIIRAPGTADAAGNPRDASNKAGLGLGFKPNDRPKIRQQIQGMHAAAAMLTKQPVFMLADVEAVALTDALCDVCDYHEMNLSDAGGPYGLYIALAITAFGIYKPRFDIIASGGKIVGVNNAAAPTSEGEATQQRQNGGGMMDFSHDTTQH